MMLPTRLCRAMPPRSLAIVAALLSLALSGQSTTTLASDILYTNGPVAGTTGADEIFGNIEVSNTFDIADPATLLSVTDIGLWSMSGETPLSVSWAIGTSPFADDVASGTDAALSVSFVGLFEDTYAVHSGSFSTGAVALAAGTYWLTLKQAASDQALASVMWDTVDGPSSALKKEGTATPYSVASHSFTLRTGVIPTPEPSTWALGGLAVTATLATARRRTRQATC